jgi:hypothetical protein
MGSRKACQAQTFRAFALFASSKFTCDEKAQHHRWTKQLHRGRALSWPRARGAALFQPKISATSGVNEEAHLDRPYPCCNLLSFCILSDIGWSKLQPVAWQVPDDQAPHLADWIAPCLVSRTFPFGAKQTLPWLFFGLATTFRVVLNKPTLW